MNRVFEYLFSLSFAFSCFANVNEQFSCTSALCSHYKTDHKAEMLTIATGYLLSRAVYTAAKLSVADFMSESEAIHIAELARQTSTHEPSLYRLLRMLASHGIFKEAAKNYFILTPKALCLTSYHESSIRDIVLGEDDTRWNAVGNLDKAVQNGQPAFDQLYSKSYFEYVADKPVLSAQFDAHMSQLTREEDYAILEALTIDSSIKTVADIGGGRGSFLAKLLRKYPYLKGMLYDLPVVINNTDKLLLDDAQNRVELQAGSFFDVFLLEPTHIS